ncbi:MAG: hypothetical protein EBV48_09020, partial [Betaproteobacteria bacterium]|nr:hypothetical protein [Betaproteobacteria bacterium]
METIRSRQNPLVQQVRRLLERPRERQQAGLAVLDGDHLVNDWLSAGRAFERVLLAESRATEAAAWLTRGTAVALLADTCFEAVSPVASPTGIVALARIPIATPVDRGLILALDAVQETRVLETRAKDVAMHVVAMAPQALAKEDLDPAVVEKEREILSDAARKEGKPENIIAKMIEGRLRNFFSQCVLLEQPFVKD